MVTIIFRSRTVNNSLMFNPRATKR